VTRQGGPDIERLIIKRRYLEPGEMVKKALVIGVIIIAVLAAGAYYIAFPEGELALPEIKSVTHEWGVVNATTTEIISHVVIYNPSGLSATIESLTYTIYVNNITMAIGHVEGPVNIPAKGEATITLSTYIDNTKLPTWWASHIRNGERSIIRVKGTAKVKAFGISFNLPFSIPAQEAITDLAERFDITNKTVCLDLPILPEPICLLVEKLDNSWGKVNETTTEIKHDLTVRNENNFTIVIPDMELEYEVLMNNIRLATGQVPIESRVLEPGEAMRLMFNTYVDNTVIDDAWVSHLLNHEKSTVVVKVYAVVGGLRLLIYEDSYTYQTDILSYISMSS